MPDIRSIVVKSRRPSGQGRPTAMAVHVYPRRRQIARASACRRRALVHVRTLTALVETCREHLDDARHKRVVSSTVARVGQVSQHQMHGHPGSIHE